MWVSCGLVGLWAGACLFRCSRSRFVYFFFLTVDRLPLLQPPPSPVSPQTAKILSLFLSSFWIAPFAASTLPISGAARRKRPHILRCFAASTQEKAAARKKKRKREERKERRAKAEKHTREKRKVARDSAIQTRQRHTGVQWCYSSAGLRDGLTPNGATSTPQTHNSCLFSQAFCSRQAKQQENHQKQLDAAKSTCFANSTWRYFCSLWPDDWKDRRSTRMVDSH